MSEATVWCVVPAAGSGQRFGGEIPKQYLHVGGRPVLRHTLDVLLSHPRVAGIVVVLAAGDDRFFDEMDGVFPKMVLTTTGGAMRADSVLSGLKALPGEVDSDALVLVHDAARPNLCHADLDALIDAASTHADGAILAAPMRDTLKRADVDANIMATEPRQALWRAFTPQAFRRGALTEALKAAANESIAITDESMAMERMGAYPRLVEGREDNLKITTPADLAQFEFLLTRREA